MTMVGSIPVVAETFVNLGPQIFAASVQSGAFLKSGDKSRIYMALRGYPGHLVGCDLASGQCILNAPLTGAGGAWRVLAGSNGMIYAAGDNGYFFRHKPGADTIEDLGMAVPGENFIWDLASGENAQVIGSTYPNARLFQYDSKNGFMNIGDGPLVVGEKYARTVIYDARRRRVYVGIGTIHAHLIQIDLATGKKKELLSDQMVDQTMVYSLVLVPEEKTGDRLLVWLAPGNDMLVYNLATCQVERRIKTEALKSALKSPEGSLVYYSDGTSLMSFNLNQPNETPRAIGPCASATAMEWMDANHLCVLDRYGQLFDYVANTGEIKQRPLKVPSQPIPIQPMTSGPDGKLWMGGFLAGGTAAFDPIARTSVRYKGLDQTERIGLLGDDIYFGVYPYAQLFRFNPNKPWNKNNPRQLAQLKGQSRPMAVLGVPELAKVFTGTVPEYGQLGGHLFAYDPAIDQLDDCGEIVPRQSVISLAYSNGILLGGTSIAGGMGVKPVTAEAKLFAWDPAKQRKILEITPVSGATALTCLIKGPDKNIWGVANGTLFIFDPRTRQILSRHELLKVDYGPSGIYRDAFLVAHPSGQVYGTLAGKLFRIDPDDMKIIVLRDHDASMLAMDRDGRLYFRDIVNLWQYTI